MMKGKEKVRKNVFTCDIYHRKFFRFRKRKVRKKIFLHVIFAMENIFVFETSKHFVIIKYFVTAFFFYPGFTKVGKN